MARIHVGITVEATAVTSSRRLLFIRPERSRGGNIGSGNWAELAT